MCGIAGFIADSWGRDQRTELINKMNNCLIHRGPDAEGIWLDEQSGATLGHRRLSIQDLSPCGAQPMMSHSGRFVMAYNGEIYNVEDLKTGLKQAGHDEIWRGTSDTEVLLEAMEHLGIEKALKTAKGMFAIALYDRQKKTLSLMRDRVGEKPLFYGSINGCFVFASELTAIRQFPGFAKKIDQNAVSGYIRYGYVPAPDTIYAGIRKLMPGTVMTLSSPFAGEGSDMIQSYWSMEEAAKRGEEAPFSGSFEEAVEELDRILRDAVKGQMVSDVPLGAYLSAGIDSATIVALMSRINTQKVKTFTIGFEEKKYNEADAAKEIAKHLETDHTEVYVGEKELKEVIPKIPFMYGEPFADSSQIPTYLVSRLAKEKVTVVLSGDAGDELFCGYQTYVKLLRVWQKAGKVPWGLRNIAGKLGNTLAGGNQKIYRGTMCLQAENAVVMKEALGHMSRTMDRLAWRGIPLRNNGSQLLKDECASLMLDDMLHYHPDDILVKVDRAGMAVSLENRIPMLDRDVIEFAWSLPMEYKYDGITTKRVLKEVLYRYVPKDLLDRPKKGFSVPLERWLKEGDTAEWAKDLLLHSKAAEDRILDPAEVNRLWKQFETKGMPPRLVWTVLMLEQWYRCHLSGEF